MKAHVLFPKTIGKFKTIFRPRENQTSILKSGILGPPFVICFGVFFPSKDSNISTGFSISEQGIREEDAKNAFNRLFWETEACHKGGGGREKKEKKAGVEVTNQNSTLLLLFENQKSQRHTWKRKK